MSVPWQQIGASIGSLVTNGAAAAFGHSASQQLEDAAWQNQQANRRNLLMQLGLYEPQRYSGYQALNDVNNFFGYSTPAYQSANTLATSLNPLSGKQVKKFVKQGMSVDQIAGMGTLNAGKKTISRLIKAGLTPEQITRLQNGVASNASAAPATGAGGSAGGSTGSAGGGENWNALFNSPDYQFVRSEGERGIGNTFAARGGAASGNALRALEQFRQGLASQQIDKFLNRRFGLMGYGTQANNAISSAGNNYANNLMSNNQAIGDARASGILGISNALQQHNADAMRIWGGGGQGGGMGNFGSWIGSFGGG